MEKKLPLKNQELSLETLYHLISNRNYDTRAHLNPLLDSALDNGCKVTPNMDNIVKNHSASEPYKYFMDPALLKLLQLTAAHKVFIDMNAVIPNTTLTLRDFFEKTVELWPLERGKMMDAIKAHDEGRKVEEAPTALPRPGIG